MKKILGIFAAAVIALSFASCTPDEPSSKDFKITVDSITAVSAYVNVVPKDTASLYFWSIFETKEIATASDDSIYAWINEEIEYTIDMYANYGIELTRMDFLEKGTSDYTFTGLDPETDYTVCAFKADAEGKFVGTVNKRTFQTLKLEKKGTKTIALAGVFEDATAMGYYELEAMSEDEYYYLYLSPDVTSMTEHLTLDNFSDPDYLYFVAGTDEPTIIELDLAASLSGAGVLTLSGSFTATDGYTYNATIVADEYSEGAAPKKVAGRKTIKPWSNNHMIKR
jgi:hypothetical protein